MFLAKKPSFFKSGMVALKPIDLCFSLISAFRFVLFIIPSNTSSFVLNMMLVLRLSFPCILSPVVLISMSGMERLMGMYGISGSVWGSEKAFEVFSLFRLTEIF